MDTAQTITHVSLCAGYGGIDLGLKRAIPSLRTVAFSEIEAFACANLVAKMEAGFLDPAPIWSNLKTFPWAAFHGRVDILSGGYPCQPFSSAGKRLGEADPRHLWPFIADGIARMRPGLCFFENVEGHITLGLRNVLHDLGEMGYRTTWGIFSAAEVGAPHQRKRVFILAHRDDEGPQGHRQPVNEQVSQGWQGAFGHAWPSRPSEPQHEWEPPRVVGNSASRNGERQQLHLRQGQGEHRGTSGIERDWRRQTQPPLGGDADGPAGGVGYAELCVSCDNRTDELRLLGNGVVPATATKAFLTLYTELFP